MPLSESQLDQCLAELSFAEIPLHPEPDNKRRFSSFAELRQFVDNEYAIWNQHRGDNKLNEVFEVFNQAKSCFNQARSANDTNQARNFMSQARTHLIKNQYPLLYSETAIGQLVLQAYKSNPARAAGVLSFLSRSDLRRILAEPEFLAGVLAAFQFLDGDRLMKSRSEAEELSLSLIRGRSNAVLDEAKRETADHNSKTIEWKDTFTRDFDHWSDETRRQFEARMQEEAETFKTSFEAWQKKVGEVQDLYREKLRLEEPARYWEELETKYEAQGSRWRFWTILPVSVL